MSNMSLLINTLFVPYWKKSVHSSDLKFVSNLTKIPDIFNTTGWRQGQINKSQNKPLRENMFPAPNPFTPTPNIIIAGLRERSNGVCNSNTVSLIKYCCDTN